MKVSTSLVVAAVLVALSTSVNAKTASTSVFASEPSDSDPTEELSLSSESTAEQSDKDNSKSLVDTKDATGDPPEDLYDFDAPCASDDGDTKKGLTGEQSEEDSSTPLYDFDAPCEPDGGDTKGGLTDEQSDEDSSTPLYDFSSPSCASDPDQIGGFTDEEKAIWIERHNYFRVAALPWAAGNMKRMNWDDELAKEAASTAESCTAETTAGLNVFKATSTDSSSVIDEALNDWAVKPALSNIGSVVPPAKEGDSVGAGLYNSYTQVIWAETTSVGCAMASCSGGSMVVCKYSPAGNDGKSPWFVHAAQAKLCPTGTTAVLGLCVVEGDPANKLIAPIPKGKSSLEVYSTFIADIMATILKAAKARDAPGADPVAVVSPDGSVSELTKEPSASDTEASPDPLTDDKTEATGEGKEATSEDLSTSDLSTLTGSLPQKSKSLDMFKDLGESSETSPSTSSGEKSSGTVKPSSESGGDNETPTESAELGDPTKEESAELGDPTKQESAELGDPTKEESAELGDPTKQESAELGDPAKQESAELGDPTKQESAELGTSSNSDLKATAMANTQSSIITSNGGGPSPAAIAGIVVAGVVAVAVVAVFISYRKNQQRQRDIMQDGGV